MTDGQHTAEGDPLDTLFDVLRHGTRRRILVELADHNPRTEAEFEADELAAGSEKPDSADTELRHVHLPALADAGFISWDSRTGTITRGPRFGEIVPLLVVIDDHHDTLPGDWP